MEERRIASAVIKRMPRYYRYLGQLIDNGIKKTSSKELSALMNITASQIRQDLNNFGCFGQQGYGYDVNSLYLEVKKILGINHAHNMIIVGCGNLGQALANYKNFGNRGFNVIGIFDKNPETFKVSIRGVSVSDIEEMPPFLKDNEVDIAVLTLPKEAVYQVATLLVDHNVKGIWNFSGMELVLPDRSVIVENTQLTDSLMTLAYRLNDRRQLEKHRDQLRDSMKTVR
ncbi:MAG: redox-sensing transcriptional repressor Rex [Defluviitaleaceae bacterium]|nr:redox-sensing transcriptional repressor Rex [Defluviitaleaceae bacterium]